MSHNDEVMLRAARKWADDQLDPHLGNPPWVWFQCMKLREVLDQIIESDNGTIMKMPIDGAPVLELVPKRKD